MNKKYYLVILLHDCGSTRDEPLSIQQHFIDFHPLDFQLQEYKNNAGTMAETIILSWKELNEEEYNKYSGSLDGGCITIR